MNDSLLNILAAAETALAAETLADKAQITALKKAMVADKAKKTAADTAAAARQAVQSLIELCVSTIQSEGGDTLSAQEKKLLVRQMIEKAVSANAAASENKD